MLHDAAWQARIACVLSGALRVWGLSGTVERDPEHAERFVVSTAAGSEVRIIRRAAGGWVLALPDESRAEHPLAEHEGLPGLLRRLREELAPDAAAGRLVIGSQPLLGGDAGGTGR